MEPLLQGRSFPLTARRNSTKKLQLVKSIKKWETD